MKLPQLFGSFRGWWFIVALVVGPAIATGLNARHLKVDWSPDGRRLVFAFNTGRETELWLMDNFRP